VSDATGNFLDYYESTTISKKTLCQLQDREAQERCARDLQEPAPQAAPGMNDLIFNL
jgi:hypothetical protein